MNCYIFLYRLDYILRIERPRTSTYLGVLYSIKKAPFRMQFLTAGSLLSFRFCRVTNPVRKQCTVH